MPITPPAGLSRVVPLLQRKRNDFPCASICWFLELGAPSGIFSRGSCGLLFTSSAVSSTDQSKYLMPCTQLCKLRKSCAIKLSSASMCTPAALMCELLLLRTRWCWSESIRACTYYRLVDPGGIQGSHRSVHIQSWGK